MSRGPENTFIAAVHRHLPVSLYRMKNHNEYNGGIADCWYSSRSDAWIEYKFIKVPVRDGTVIDLIGGKDPSISYLQQNWLLERHREGRTIGVIVGSEKGGVWFPGDSWNTTYTAKFFREHLQTRKDLALVIERLTGAP